MASGAAAISGSIQVGDYLLRVEDVDVTGLPFAEVKALILGPVGTALQLKLDRRSKDGQPKIWNTTIVRIKHSKDSQNTLSRTNASLRVPVNRIDVAAVEERTRFPLGDPSLYACQHQQNLLLSRLPSLTASFNEIVHM